VLPDVDEAAFKGRPCVHQICRTCRLEAEQEDADDILALACPLCRTAMRSGLRGQDSPWSNRLPRCYQPSSKVRALLRNLNQDKGMAATGLPPQKRFVLFNMMWILPGLLTWASALFSPPGRACLI
jgi:hypothetical protein